MPVKPIPNNPWEADALVEDEMAADPEVRDTPALLGGAGATMGAGGAESVWERARRTLAEAFGGHPDRDESIADQPTTAKMLETAGAGAAAMLGGAAMGGIAAAPLRAGAAAAGGYHGEGAGRAVGRKLEEYGAPEGTERVVGAAGGVVGGLGLSRGAMKLAGSRLADALRRRVSGAPAGSAAADAAPANVTPFPSRAAQEAPSVADDMAAQVQAKIVALRERGLSGAQITASLRDLFGIPPGQGQKAVEMVLESMKRGGR